MPKNNTPENTPEGALSIRALFGISGRVANMIKPSVILDEKGPLRWKSQVNGVPKLQGVFTMRDQEGLPLDMAYEIAKERGWEVDWVEALADAARQCIFKYDALIEEIGMLEPEKLEAVKRIFACGIMSSEGATFCDKAKHLYQRMRESHLPNNTAPPSVDVPRLVRLCRFCAQKLDLWMEWKSNHCPYDHATSRPCDECNGENLRNPESIFTVKLRLPNVEAIHPESKPYNHE